MKKLCLLLLILSITGFVFAQANPDSIDLALPQFVNPFFDSFAYNYLGAVASGRGHTGVALNGGLASVLLNPAAYNPQEPDMILEVIAKPPVDAYNSETGARYVAEFPLGIFAVGRPLGSKFSGALQYSQQKSLMMDSFSFVMHGGAYILQRYPKYNLHQFTANLAYHGQRVHAGLSIHNQLHYLDDVPVLRTFERIDDLSYVPRVEAGIIYMGDRGSVGLALTPSTPITWDLKYAEYDTVLPLKIGLGSCFKVNDKSFLLDLDFEQFSEVHPSFDDRLRVKAGFELSRKAMIYRLGYIYSPQVYTGEFNLPVNTTANADTSNVWNNVIGVGEIGENTQHILSAGLSFNHRYGSINLSFMQALSTDAPLTQVNIGLGVFLDALKSPTFLRKDDETESKPPQN